MTEAITIPRSVVEQALEHLTCAVDEPVREALLKALEQPQGEQEPRMLCDVCASYVAYPSPKRQPLTDEQIFDLAEQFGEFRYGDAQGHKRIDFARAIERAHGIGGAP